MFELTPFVRKNRVSVFDPFRDFEDFERSFFGRQEALSFKTDIKEKKDCFVLEAELPGFSKDDISVDIDGDYLTISANRSAEKEDKDHDGYVRRERSWGTYSRSFDISSVRGEEISAEYKDGVLTLNLPKKDVTAPTARKLEIK